VNNQVLQVPLNEDITCPDKKKIVLIFFICLCRCYLFTSLELPWILIPFDSHASPGEATAGSVYIPGTNLASFNSMIICLQTKNSHFLN
jgi:hypothetical protein